MNYSGFYINLDNHPERRAEIESQLAERELAGTYRRFAAAKGNKLDFPNPHLTEGEIGAFTSHYLLLKENLDTALPLHIIEDDVLLARCMQQSIGWLVEKNFFDTYDIIYTDLFIPTSNAYYKTYKNLFDRTTKRDANGRVTEASFQLVDLHEKKFGTASSLLVSPRAVKKLHDLYETELKRGPQAPIDIFVWQQAMKNEIKPACIFPFVTSLRLGHSIATTIEARYDQLSVLARDIARVSFFVDRDLDHCREYISKFLPLPDDLHLQILTHILGFSFTDKFVDI